MSRRTTLRLLIVALPLAAALNMFIVVAGTSFWPANVTVALLCLGLATWLYRSERR